MVSKVTSSDCPKIIEGVNYQKIGVKHEETPYDRKKNEDQD